MLPAEGGPSHVVRCHLFVVGAMLASSYRGVAEAQQPLGLSGVAPLDAVAEARLVGDVAPGAGQGLSVALTQDGTRAVVGSTRGTVSFFELRGAYWTSRGTWTPHEPSPARSVDIDAVGSLAVVGLPDHGDRRGCVLVLARHERGWTEQAILDPSGPHGAVMFGRSVAIAADGSRLAVGAPRHPDMRGHAVGAVTVFRRDMTGWTREAILTTPTAGRGSELGLSVSISANGTLVLAGAPGEGTDDRHSAGAVHAFALGPEGWTELAVLRASDASRGDRFGTSVSLDDASNRVVVGAPGDDVEGRGDAGSARVFAQREGRWDEVAVLTLPELAGSARFGLSVAMASGRVVVGSRGGIVIAEDLERRDLSRALLQPSRSGRSSFGAAVALSDDGRRALVGAPTDDPRGARRAGSAQVFALSSGQSAPGASAPLAQAARRLPAPRVAPSYERAMRASARLEALPPRVLAQAGVGVLLAGLSIGAELAFLSELRSPWSCGGLLCIDSGHVFSAIGLVLVPLGASAATLFAIRGTGDALHGHGSLAATALGYLGGAALGVAVVVGAEHLVRPGGVSTSDYEPIMAGAMTIAAALAVTGAILGYAITDQGEQARDDEPDLVPIVSLTPEGGSVGVSGTL